MQPGRQLVLGAEGKPPLRLNSDRDHVELRPPAGGCIEVGQRVQVIAAELRVSVHDHPHGQRGAGRERIGDQLAEVGVVGRPELRLDDDVPPAFVAGAEIQAQSTDSPMMTTRPDRDILTLADHNFPADVLQPLHAQVRGEVVEMIGQPADEVALPRPPTARVAHDPTAAVRHSAIGSRGTDAGRNVGPAGRRGGCPRPRGGRQRADPTPIR